MPSPTCAGVVLAVPMLISTPAGAEQEISGKYRMQGRSDPATGAGYEDTCELSRRELGYDVACIGGTDNYRGRRIVHGEVF